jgi:sirohydrochlorin ferrochelatase
MAKLIDVLEHEALMHYRDKVGVLLRQAASEIRALQNRLRRKASGKKQSLALTNEAREAISEAACICEDAGRVDIAIIVNTALSRLG